MNPINYKSAICFIAFFTAVFLGKGCSSNPGPEEAHAKTEKLFLKELEKENVNNAFLAVFSPSRKINWEFVGGNFQNGKTVSAANPFYTASIGKTFTAAAIAILTEQGKLKFEDKISTYLPDTLLDNLHVFEGKDYSDELTIAQLLQHTSGLPDYFEGETIDGSPNVMEQIFADTERFWEPSEAIGFTKARMQPLFVPGTGYGYTDTEYVLLGLIIENVSGLPLHDYFREHIFRPLEMKHSYMNLRSAPVEATGKLSELYAGVFEASTMTSLSADWAGGGLVSTTGDLIKFQHALNTGKLVSSKTLKIMQNWVPETHGMEYGYGLRRVIFGKLFPLLPDLTIVGHSGSTGSFMYYCPELDVYLAGTLNQTEEVKNTVQLILKILVLLNNSN